MHRYVELLAKVVVLASIAPLSTPNVKNWNSNNSRLGEDDGRQFMRIFKLLVMHIMMGGTLTSNHLRVV